MKTCSNSDCQAELNPAEQFCTKCGTRFSVDADTPKTIEQPLPPSPPPPTAQPSSAPPHPPQPVPTSTSTVDPPAKTPPSSTSSETSADSGQPRRTIQVGSAVLDTTTLVEVFEPAFRLAGVLFAVAGLLTLPTFAEHVTGLVGHFRAALGGLAVSFAGGVNQTASLSQGGLLLSAVVAVLAAGLYYTRRYDTDAPFPLYAGVAVAALAILGGLLSKGLVANPILGGVVAGVAVGGLLTATETIKRWLRRLQTKLGASLKPLAVVTGVSYLAAAAGAAVPGSGFGGYLEGFVRAPNHLAATLASAGSPQWANYAEGWTLAAVAGVVLASAIVIRRVANPTSLADLKLPAVGGWDHDVS